MPESNSVVLQTTKNVVRKTTPLCRREAEIHRVDAWSHLKTPQAPDPDSWMGELARIPRALEHTGTVTEIAAKYDRILELIEYDTPGDLTETDLLAALLVQRALRDKLQIDEGRLIAAARRKNITWARLAPALEVRSRQSAERRYLQLRRDLDGIVGHPLTQSDRVEAARTQRDRKAEQRWAADHSIEIVALARRLAAVPGLQQRADTCPKVTRANQVAVLHARRAGEPDPVPVRTAWPARLVEVVAAEEAHRAAQAAMPQPAMDPGPDLMAPKPAPLTSVRHSQLVHQMFSLIGYAIDSDNVDLADHHDLVLAIRQLYAEAGPNAPRAPEDYTSGSVR
ncbi:hypothetical protein [Streptomyces sp. 8N706]|uniref:hypothetical protein n=1 Tax=Streptomyces sp. 8N706 TaxID=3457416 RepID=UPI003FCEF97E